MASRIERRKFLDARRRGGRVAARGAGQQAGVPLIGLLAGAQLDDRRPERHSARREGRWLCRGLNVAIKYRTADGRFNRLPGLAAELVADPVAGLLVGPTGCGSSQSCNREPFRSFS